MPGPTTVLHVRAAGRFAFPAILLLLLLLHPAHAAAQERVTFIGVALDRETREADRRLSEYLYQKSGVQFSTEDLEYERVVERLVNWRPTEGQFVARATPYVYVAAEMLGAPLDVLATYESATTGRTTYLSYFVVRRQDFSAAPSSFEVERWLREKNPPARFVYHNQFSTSSYLLPSLHFRAHGIFNMSEATESLTAVRADRVADAGSSRLVEMVARGEADLAAVWDGTKKKYEPGGELYAQYGQQLHFVPLPTELPNDLLVCSRGMDQRLKDSLREAIRNMGHAGIQIGDFKTWRSFSETPEARLALGNLRWLVREHPAPATVDVRVSQDEPRADLLEAGRQAVRLAGGDFVLYDRDFHAQSDFRWTLEPIHDGAVVLRSAIPGADLEDQTFRLSFNDVEDLTKRLVTTVASRLHRIRYVWPYSPRGPLLIRDLAFALPAGAPVKVQRVTWVDPERNKFRAGPLFTARIRHSTFYQYELDHEDFSRAGERPSGFDAMSNTAYRVILIRPDEGRPLFRAMTVLFVVVLAGAAAAAGWDLLRGRRRASVRVGRFEP